MPYRFTQANKILQENPNQTHRKLHQACLWAGEIIGGKNTKISVFSKGLSNMWYWFCALENCSTVLYWTACAIPILSKYSVLQELLFIINGSFQCTYFSRALYPPLSSWAWSPWSLAIACSIQGTTVLHTRLVWFPNWAGVKSSLKALCIFTTVTKHVFICSWCFAE